MSIELINEILQNKWKELEELEKGKEEELEKEESLSDPIKEAILNLSSFEDFLNEFENYNIFLEEEEIEREKANDIILFFYKKWSYIFCSILNLDLRNFFIVTLIQTTLLKIIEEVIESEEEIEPEEE